MTDTSNLEAATTKGDYLGHTKHCDLVMKGGLTSGIVYPATVLKLAKDYKFHSVGGTSAGAIAAAVTAAAEAGRKCRGFEKLEKVAAEIAQSGFLLSIFRAGGPTRSLMSLLVSVLARRPKSPGKLRKLWFFGPALYVRLLRFLPCTFLGGALLGMLAFAAIAYLTAFLGHSVNNWCQGLPQGMLRPSGTLWCSITIVAICGFAVGSVLGPMARIFYLLLSHLPKRNFFGICTGYIPGDPAVLTNWLHRKINDLYAGRSETDPAVTFAELEQAGVKLKAISTNLAQNRPYIFPREPEGFHLVFNEQELTRLFPPAVIDVLKRPPAKPFHGPKLPEGYFYLPERGDLPVVVATRMSLSFPVLISAIPMYEVKKSAYEQMRHAADAAGKEESDMRFGVQDLHKHWFSDGGICSNFPIGLFDVWLPKYPTFGINLNYLKSGQKRGTAVPSEHVPTSDESKSSTMDDVYLLPVTDRSRPQWNSIDQLPTFFGAILESARNYRDTLQSMLPSYSERIVQVWLDPEEGGMNLTMDRKKLDSLVEKGTKAGDLLAGMDFDAHRCMRLRVLLKVLCKEIENLHSAYPAMSDYEAIAAGSHTWCGDPTRTFWPDVKPYIDSLVVFAHAWSNGKPCSSICDKLPPTFEGDLHIHPKI